MSDDPQRDDDATWQTWSPTMGRGGKTIAWAILVFLALCALLPLVWWLWRLLSP